jgi:hypothetical protein
VIGVALGEALSRLQVRLFLDQSHLRGSPTLGERARVKRGLWSNAFLDTLRPGRRQLIQQGPGGPKKSLSWVFGRDFREFLWKNSFPQNTPFEKKFIPNSCENVVPVSERIKNRIQFWESRGLLLLARRVKI